MFIIRVVLMCFLALVILVSFNMGMDYVNFGPNYHTAVHPYIAFPIAAISVIMLMILYYWTLVCRYLSGE